MLLVVIMFLTILWLVVRWKRRNSRRLLKKLETDLVALPFVGHSYIFIGSQEDMMSALKFTGKKALEKGGVASFWHGSTPYIMIADPRAAEVVLKNCLEKDDVMNITRVVLGNGSIFAPVSEWHSRRKTLAPTFNVKNLTKFVDIFANQSSILVQQLGKFDKGDPFSPWNDYTTYTMNSVCETTLGLKIEAQQTPNMSFLVAMEEIFRIFTHIMTKPWLHSPFIYTKLQRYKILLKHKRFVYDLVDKIIEEKRSEKPQNVDKEGSLKPFVELLIQGKDNALTDISIREECVVIMLAGTDTSAVGTAFTTAMLAKHQDVQEKVVEELKEVFQDYNRPVQADDLHRLKYLDAVIKETMRLYPPVPVIVRKIDRDLELPSGVTIPKGCGAAINIWATHRNPEYWGEDADEFRPERFLEPLKHPGAFMPFSYGPRRCLGYQYAMMSIKTALATLLREYRVAPPTDLERDEELSVKFDFMMRDVDDYRVRIYRRK